MRDPQSATDMLRAEHRLILRVTNAFEMLLDAQDAGAPPLDSLADCLVFFRLFTDACHHGKEEDLLFTVMEDQQLPGIEGPVAVMREEHMQGRRIVARMAAALERAQSGEATATPELQREGREYVDFIRAHIRKEDEGVFEIADEFVRGDACSALCAAYETVCSRRFEGRSLQELETLADRIIRR